MNKLSKIMLLLVVSPSIFAKAQNPQCAGATGSQFSAGDGSAANPYLICNNLQYARLASEPGLLNLNFKLGADLDFTQVPFGIIGSYQQPFVGTFDGDLYTLSHVNINASQSYVGIFSHLNNATIQNLIIDNLNITNSWNFVGGLSGLAENSVINNIKISHLSMNGPDYSGGLFGQASNTTISNIVVQGNAYQIFGTDAGGGLVGLSWDSTISNCAVHVNLIQTSTTAFGVSDVGGIIGLGSGGSLSNCYSDGNIDYTAVTEVYGILPHYIGGIAGQLATTNTEHVYYAGEVKVKDAENLGAGCGGNYPGEIPTNTVFWDSDKSIVNISTCGIGEPTLTMTNAAFWTSNGFDTSVWNIVDNAYPKLQIEN